MVVSLPFVSRHFLAALLEQAGVHRYLDDRRMCSGQPVAPPAPHARGGKKRVRLPRSGRLVDLTTGEMLEATDGIVNLELAPASTSSSGACHADDQGLPGRNRLPAATAPGIPT